MSQPIAQAIVKQGTSISKDKLVEIIKKSKDKQIAYLAENNGKTLVVVITVG